MVGEGDRLAIVVSGGSMGGLFTGLALRDAGHAVEVFERSTGELESRGGGIVAQPRMLEFLDGHGVVSPGEITTTTARRRYLDRDDGVEREYADRMTFTSWDALYRRLRDAFPNDRYRMGKRTVDADSDGRVATLAFDDGSSARGDLAVVAEGGRSSTRDRLLPGVEPEYAGYVAWRGVTPESAVPDRVRERFEGVFTFYQGPDDLVLGYLIPGPDGGTAAGERRLNWVWYDAVHDRDERRLLTDEGGRRREFSVPPGELRSDVERKLRTASAELPATFADLVGATDEPFVQAIYDLTVPELVFDRICLLGDAAFVARPHTAAGTAKAAADGIELAAALEGEDVEAALDDWEEARLEAGRRLVAKGRRMGENYMN